MRKTTKTKASFVSEEALTKLLYLTLMKKHKVWKKRILAYNAIIRSIKREFKDRFDQHFDKGHTFLNTAVLLVGRHNNEQLRTGFNAWISSTFPFPSRRLQKLINTGPGFNFSSLPPHQTTPVTTQKKHPKS